MSVQLFSLLEDLMSVRRGSLQESDSRDTVPTWTSLVDVQITVFLASEFGIDPDPELLQAETVGELVRKVEQHRAL